MWCGVVQCGERGESRTHRRAKTGTRTDVGPDLLALLGEGTLLHGGGGTLGALDHILAGLVCARRHAHTHSKERERRQVRERGRKGGEKDSQGDTTQL